jgi:amidase
MDPVTTCATQLCELLSTNKLTSVDIVEQYLDQISRHESVLNAFTSLAPCNKLIKVARTLDAERSGNNLRSPLHGIPIVLKVSPR